MALSTLQGALELGLIYAILAFGVYISFRILDIPDLSVDGTFITGCGAAAICTLNGHPYLGVFAALIAGALAGGVTGFLQTKCKIQPILSGILVMSGLYSINYKIMGNTPNISLFDKETIFTQFSSWSQSKLMPLILCILIVIMVFIVLYVFLKTQLGMCLRATGDNEAMVRASSVNSDRMKILGLALANGLVAFSGGILAQYQNFADVNDGIGKLVIGLASIIVGEAFFGKKTLFRSFLAVVSGAIVYRFLLTFALQLGVNATDQRLLSALLVTLAISFPVLKKEIMKRRKRTC
ncbi:ABC transporter permease [bacterium c-19]|nr:ABC transporter permease [bacterium c-19]